jgi:hypothetical protein
MQQTLGSVSVGMKASKQPELLTMQLVNSDIYKLFFLYMAENAIEGTRISYVSNSSRMF